MPARLFAVTMAAGLSLQPVQYSAGPRRQQSARDAWAGATKSMDAAGGILLRVLESLGVMAAQ